VIRPEQLQFTTEQKNRRWIARCNQLPDIRATGATRIDALDDIMRQAFYRLREIDRQDWSPRQ
jgi:hypothetical protein